jgi:transaldolase
MELYLDSVNFQEIEEAFNLGFLTGLTTTPTFMHRDGITDIDGAIVKLSKMVPELQVEALGNTHDEIIDEAHRLLDLPLAREPVFKVPIRSVRHTWRWPPALPSFARLRDACRTRGMMPTRCLNSA